MREMAADIVIIGGRSRRVRGGDLAAARSGRRVLLTEETDWIGGQLTSQATPPDEHPWIENFGCTRTYREFRNRVRDYYRRNYPLSQASRERWNLNPGDGSVSRLCHEPRAALAVLNEMLTPFVSAGTVQILLYQKAVRTETEGDFRSRRCGSRFAQSGDETVLTASALSWTQPNSATCCPFPARNSSRERRRNLKPANPTPRPSRSRTISRRLRCASRWNIIGTAKTSPH